MRTSVLSMTIQGRVREGQARWFSSAVFSKGGDLGLDLGDTGGRVARCCTHLKITMWLLTTLLGNHMAEAAVWVVMMRA